MKIVLWISLICNLLLVGAVCFYEMKAHTFERLLVQRGVKHSVSNDMASPDFWARVGWTNTIEKLHTDFDVAFFGNSITRGSDFQEKFPDKKIINLGYAGDDVAGMINRVGMIKQSKAKKVFIMAGTNDLRYLNLDEYRKRYSELIAKIQKEMPGTEIYLQSILPSNHKMANYAPNEKIREANAVAKELAEKTGCTNIDLYSLYADSTDELPANLTKDGVHLHPESYDRWADKIKPYIYN